MRHVRGSCGSSRRVFAPWISTWPSATEASIPPRLNSGELLLCSTVEARRSTSTTSSSPPLESSADSFVAKRTRLMAERASASADNVSRLRELLQTCSAHERRGLFSNDQPHRRRDVWPLTTPVEPPTPSPGVTARMKKSVASDTPRFLSTAVIQSFQEGASHNAAAAAQHGTAQCSQKEQQEKGYYHSPSWYGASPGTRMDITYFTAHQSSRWNALFHDLYYTRNEPTAPLLRCPACVTQRLRGDVAMLPRTGFADLSASRAATETPSASSPLWMDPMELQRHLSYIHADELFTPQELKLYNAQVLRELRYSCGLAPALTPVEGELSTGVTSGARKMQPARVILVVDVANVELGSPGELLEMLLSSKLLRAVTDFPVALCATHELFVPAISKALHTLYQLSRRHPASTLHVFFANTSLESGDLLTSSYLNDLFLASPHCAVPPVVMLTSDVQQQRALTELHGAPAYGMGNGGHVHWVKPLTAAQLVVDLYAALESSQSLL
ncbi:hypothetical protein LPMP_261070 [Leishmania panamensis]|uniref:Uncharacterized protein n=1 Tax=Leishmania panamensis TaxID=5679 RepID=A0A088RTK0_LEIPA|nr:hypothetical protein LPMP_261070 [Leishmania panamensis]AIN99220.1 hypothetical protein LPMP_261070 [Leishmania panamensis]